MPSIDLDALLDDHGDWNGVANALRERAAADPAIDSRVEVFRALADVLILQIGDPAAGAEALESLLELAPDHPGALDDLRESYELSGNDEALAGVLIDLADGAEAPLDAAAFLRRAAALYSGSLGRPDEGRLLLQRALEVAPECRDCWAAAEQAWGEAADPSGLADVLSRALGGAAERLGEPATVPLLSMIARAHAEAGSLELAEAFLSRAAALDDRNEELLLALAEVQEASEDWEALVETLRRLTDAALSETDELDRRRRLAATLRDRLDDRAGAAAAYQRAHAISRSREDFEEAATLYASIDDRAALLSLLRARASEASDPEERAEVFSRVATLCTDDGDAASAIAAWRDALFALPTHSVALRGLADALEANEDWSGLSDHLDRWKRVSADEDQPALLLRRAEVLETRLGDTRNAISVLEELRAIDDTATGCLESLLRLYSATDRGTDALAVLLRLAEQAPDAAVRVERTLQAAAQSVDLGETLAAVGLYRSVLDADPTNAIALREIEPLQRVLGDSEGAIQSLRSLLGQDAEPDSRRARLLQIAELQAPTDAVAASTTLRELLVEQPDDAEATSRLVALLESRGEWDELIATLRGCVGRETDIGALSRLHSRIGEVLAVHLDRPTDAQSEFERAIELDPTNAAAARPLAEIWLAAEAWERAHPMLRALAGSLDAASTTEERRALHLNLAIASEQLGLSDEALREFEATLVADPMDVVAAVAIGRLHRTAGRHAAAAAAFVDALERHRDTLPIADRVDLCCRAGEAYEAAADPERAAACFREALELDELHELALRGVARTAPATDGVQSVDAKQRLLQITESPLERFALLVEIGDDLVASGFAAGAVEAYDAALEIERDSKAVLHKLLSVHTTSGAWTDAARVLMRLAELESEPTKRVRLLFTVGAVFRDELGDLDRAIEVFERLLNLDAVNVEAADALEALHCANEDWAALERAWRRAIERLLDRDDPVATAFRFDIVMRLAALYRDRLDRPDDALAALEVAASIRPDDADVREAMTYIYPRAGKSDEQTIAEHRALVRLRPDREDSYHLLFGAYKRQRLFDDAWTAASILTVLGNRERQPTEFYREHRPASVPVARRGLSHAELVSCYHPSLSVPATRLLSVIAETLRRVYSNDVKHWGVNRRSDWLDTAAANPLNNLFHYAAQAIGAPLPALYRWRGGNGFQNANTDPRSVLVGNDVHDAAADRRLVFQIARTLCLLRSEFYLASAVAPATLTAMVQAAISLFIGGPPAAWNTESVRAWMPAIQREPSAVLSTLGAAVQEYVSTGQPLDLRAWSTAVELSAGRVALLLCGDLPRAVQASDALTSPVGNADSHERAIDLIRFAASADYSVLRGELGLGIGQQ